MLSQVVDEVLLRSELVHKLLRNDELFVGPLLAWVAKKVWPLAVWHVEIYHPTS